MRLKQLHADGTLIKSVAIVSDCQDQEPCQHQRVVDCVPIVHITVVLPLRPLDREIVPGSQWPVASAQGRR